MKSIFLALNNGMQKILCVGDGFGKGHVWPMWPQLLPEIVNDTEVVNLSEVGAGNEYISQCVIDSCEQESYDLVIALTAGGPGISSDMPAVFMTQMAFHRSEIGLASASAIMMFLTVSAIVVPYLYSELKREDERK